LGIHKNFPVSPEEAHRPSSCRENPQLAAHRLLSPQPGPDFYKKKFGKKYCPQDWWNEEELEQLFVHAISNLHFDDGIFNWLKDQLNEDSMTSQELAEMELKNLRKEFSSNEEIQRRIYKDRIDGIIPDDFFKKEFESLRSRQSEIQSRISDLEDASGDLIAETVLTLELFEMFHT
jgi:hypothetical protein